MLYLNKLAKQEPCNKTVLIKERLPDFIVGPCQLDVDFEVVSKDDFYLINLNVRGEPRITCQRCMNEFPFAYHNATTIAVCISDERAEQLLEHYECIVSPNFQVNLDDLITDELHLYLPQFHQELNDCDPEIRQILTSQSETY